MRFSVENWSKKVFSKNFVGYGRYGRYVGYGRYSRYKLENRIEVDASQKSARSFLRVVFDAESFGDSPRAPFSRLSTLPVK